MNDDNGEVTGHPMITVIPFDFSSVEVRVDHFLCDSPQFLRWKRNHRKSRINKKWHKRYGAEYRYCQGKCYQMNMPAQRIGEGLLSFTIPGFSGFVVCPCFKKQLDQHIEKQENPWMTMAK